jgi:hypothetical protein
MNCPHCQRLLYSRQHARCGYCGGELPESVRLSDHQIDEMKAEISEIDARRAVAKEKEEQEREERRRRNRHQGSPGYFPPGPF